MKRFLLIATLLLSLLMILIGCSSVSKKGQSTPKDEILVKYDGGSITQADFNLFVQSLPNEQQEELKMASKQVQLLNSMAKEEAFFRKAKQLKYDTNPEVLALIETKLKPYYINDFYNEKIRTKATATDEEVSRYYEENPDFFREPATATIRYIQAKDLDSAQGIINDLKVKGHDFKMISSVKSINDYAKNNDGIIREIRNNGYIQGIGYDAVLDSLIFTLPANADEIYGPIETETGIHIFAVLNKIEAFVKPFKEVKEVATSRTMAVSQKLISDEMIDKVKKQLNISIDETILADIDFVDTSNNSESSLNNLVLRSKSKEFNWTVKDLLNVFGSIDKNERMFISQSSPEEILDHIVAKETYYYLLKKEGFDKELNKTMKYSRNIRNIILSHTYQQIVANKIVVTPQMMEDFYNENMMDFAKPAYRNIELLVFDTAEKAEKAYDKYILAANNDDNVEIEKIMQAHANNDFAKRIINNVYNNGIVPGYGKDTILNTAIWSLPVNEVSDILILKKNDQPAIFRVVGEEPLQFKPLNHVEPQIEGKLKREKATTLFESIIDQCKQEFHFVIYDEKLKSTLSVEQLFELAERQAKMGKYDDSILYYDQIISNFANGNDDYKAMFMKGFTQSEYMNNKQAAIITFTQFLAKYPKGDLNADAQVMLDILTGKTTIEIPDDIEFED